MDSHRRPDRLLSLAILGLTGLWLLTAISFPVASRRLPIASTLAIAGLSVAHAAAYWNADKLRERLKFPGYVMLHVSLAFGIAMLGALFPFGLVLLIAFTARSVVGQDMKTGVAVTLASFTTFFIASIATSDLYRGATSSLILAATGIVTYSISLAASKRTLEPATGVAVDTTRSSFMSRSSAGRAGDLTPRELEVLRAVAAGSRTADVAATMGISERTVKSHLAAIYQKLGVENRAAAVTVAMRSNLL